MVVRGCILRLQHGPILRSEIMFAFEDHNGFAF